jgi:hypothetical protein
MKERSNRSCGRALSARWRGDDARVVSDRAEAIGIIANGLEFVSEVPGDGANARVAA